MCNAVGVGNAKSDEGKNAEFGIEHFVSFGGDLRFREEEGVEIGDKVGEECKESFVEVGVEKCLLVWYGGIGFQQCQDFVLPVVAQHFENALSALLHAVNVCSAPFKVSDDVGFFDAVSLLQLEVCSRKSIVDLPLCSDGIVEFSVHFCELSVAASCAKEHERHGDKEKRHGEESGDGKEEALADPLFMVLLDDGEDGGSLHCPQSCFAVCRVVHCADEVFICPVGVAHGREDDGEFGKCAVFCHSAPEVVDGCHGEIANLLGCVLLGMRNGTHCEMEICPLEFVGLREGLCTYGACQCDVAEGKGTVGKDNVAVDTWPLDGKDTVAAALCEIAVVCGVSVDLAVVRHPPIEFPA